ncbi:MAG: 30S ribosomal protein S17 [Candidatus Latescibacteria bacterium]|nr:30S ribosomal protein S17 [Candidatus Latescibacterota bacterium]
MSEARGKRKLQTGTVVSDKAQKTVVVLVQRSLRHPLYGRVVRKRRKFMAHDEQGRTKLGDVVEIAETRPMSKRKRWRVVRVVAAAK